MKSTVYEDGCEEFGGNKSVTTDKVINMYLDEMEKKLKTSK